MKLKEVKSEKEVNLKGIDIEMVFEGASLKRVILRDSIGGYLEVGKGSYSDIIASIKAPPEMKQVWRLLGTLVNMPIQEDFDSKYNAENRLNELENAVHDDKKELKIEEVSVEVK